MHSLFPAQRPTTLTTRDHDANAIGECCPAQSSAPTHPRSFPAASCEPSRWVGHPGQSSGGGGGSPLRSAPAGVAAAVSPAASGVVPVIGYRDQLTRHRPQGTARRTTVSCSLFPVICNLAKLVALGLIRFYQACLSPVLPSACRFYPSCSTYAYEAVERWGVCKGTYLAAARLLRCRPWGSYGYDPVPEKQGRGAGGIGVKIRPTR
jgi:hypothetical protein